MEEVISKKAAEEEVSKWLDKHDVSPERREDAMIAFVIKDIVRALQYGLFIINDDGTITQKLTCPLGENGTTKEITYDSRYKIGDWHDKVKKIPAGDNYAVVFAKLSLLSGQPELVFKKMDRKDYDTAANVAVFF